MFALACCWATSLSFAPAATAQTGDLMALPTAHRTEWRPMPSATAEQVQSAPFYPDYATGEWDEVSQPAPYFFPSGFDGILPESVSSPGLLSGLLGLLLLSLFVSALGPRKAISEIKDICRKQA
jgi:hypothetical protein